MKRDSEVVKRRPQLTIFESELRMACGIAALWGDIETGGDMYGFNDRQGWPVCVLCTAPGPNAVHQSTHFTQDLDFCRRTQRVIGELGPQLHGAFHSHHGLGLNEPSSGDVGQVMGLARRNALQQWVDVIMTHVDASDGQQFGPRRPIAGLPAGLAVRANAFVYTDPQNGHMQEAALRIIQGVSPFRQALLASGNMTTDDLGEYALGLPLSRISYRHDPSQESNQATDAAEDVPDDIIEQLRELPCEAQEGVTVACRNGEFVVSLPVVPAAVIDVTFDKRRPPCITFVSFRRDAHDKATDVSRCLKELAPTCHLRDVYDLILRRKHTVPARTAATDTREGRDPYDDGRKDGINVTA